MGRLGGASSAFIVSYGAAHGAKSLIWHASELLFAFFLTEAVGLPPSHVGLILALSLLVNAVMDLVLGWLIRHVVTTSRSAGRMQMIGAVASGLTLVIFASTGALPETLQFGFALASILVFRCAYPLLDNPQNAMLAFATGDDGGRAQLASIRYLVGGTAHLALAAIFAPMMIDVAAKAQSDRFWWLCACLAALAIGTAIALYSRVRREPGVCIKGAARCQAIGVAKPMNARMGAIAIFAMAFSLSASVPIFSKLNPYFAAFGVRGVFDAGMILSAAALGSLFSQFGWSRLAQSWRLVVVLRAALATTTAGAMLFYLGAGHGGVIAAICVAIYGVGSGGVMMSVWSLLAGVAAAPNTRFPGTAAFGVYTCCSKMGHAVSAGLVGLILAGIDYRTYAAAAGPVVAWMAAGPILGGIIVAFLSIRLFEQDPTAPRPLNPPKAHIARRRSRFGQTS
ncbi:MFS transporter [Brevundimonas sp.]|uniref:MFS transporter n=1 Tax=Brevundimonas sp. TaxID=1871086 RepID=UPI003D0F8F52